MSSVSSVKPVYVQYIPPSEEMSEGEIYISFEFETAIHKCCCGCGVEVVTPLNPAQWQLSDNKGKVSLAPSIGNWSYPCQSHYFIKNNRVLWAGVYSEAAIQRVQASDQRALENYISSKNANKPQSTGGLIKQLFAAIYRSAKKMRDLFITKR